MRISCSPGEARGNWESNIHYWCCDRKGFPFRLQKTCCRRDGTQIGRKKMPYSFISGVESLRFEYTYQWIVRKQTNKQQNNQKKPHNLVHVYLQIAKYKTIISVNQVTWTLEGENDSAAYSCWSFLVRSLAFLGSRQNSLFPVNRRDETGKSQGKKRCFFWSMFRFAS